MFGLDDLFHPRKLTVNDCDYIEFKNWLGNGCTFSLVARVEDVPHQLPFGASELFPCSILIQVKNPFEKPGKEKT